MRIKNWERFQHYKDRDPPWIKLHRKLLNDREWHNLDDAAARLLVNLWMLTAESSGELPGIPDIAFRLRMPEKQVSSILPKLSHWLEQDASDMLADCKQPAPSETYSEETYREEAETEREARASARLPRKSRIPEDWWPSDEGLEYARKTLTVEQADVEAQRMLDYFLACGKTMIDWDACWRNWVRRAPDFKPRPPPNFVLTRKHANAQKLENVLERLREYSEENDSGASETPLRLVSANSGNGRP